MTIQQVIDELLLIQDKTQELKIRDWSVEFDDNSIREEQEDCFVSSNYIGEIEHRLLGPAGFVYIA